MPDHDPHGSPVLSYSIPQQTAYDSRSYIELVLPADAWLTPSATSATRPLQSRQAAAWQRPARMGASLRPSARPVDSPDPDPDPPSRPTRPVVLDLDVISPVPGSALTGTSSGVTVLVAGTAAVTSRNDVIDRVEVVVGDGAAETATDTAVGWSHWEHAVAATASGPLHLTVRAVSSSGVTTSRQIDCTVTITADPPQPDTVPPVITVESPLPGSVIYLGDESTANLTVRGRVLDPTTTPTSGIRSFTVTVDGADVPVTAVEDGTFSVETTITGLGDHTIELLAVDNAGLRQFASVRVTAATQPTQPPAVQRLLVVDRYRLATFSCGYAVGDPLKTITLTPGESATYSVKSYEKDDTTLASSSSILDSTSETAKSDFEDTLNQEQSSKSTSDESLKWHVEAKASANWGVASAQIDGGVAGGTSAAREELAKNVSNAVAKHAAEKSAQRQLDIKTSRETKHETDTENATESTVSNINLSCSLNVVFSQLLMQYVTLLCLTDVRVAYVRGDDIVDGDGNVERRFTYREFTLPQLDGLLAQVIEAGHVDGVREALLTMLGTVFDHEDEQRVMVEERQLLDRHGVPVPNGSYLRVPRGLTSTYTDVATGVSLTVPGVILSATTSTMRTASAVADCVRGLGSALDDYNTGLQETTLRARQLDVAKAELALQLVRDGNASGADVFAEVEFAPTTPARTVNGQPTPAGGGA